MYILQIMLLYIDDLLYFKLRVRYNKLLKITLKLKIVNHNYWLVCSKNPLFVRIVGYIKIQKNFLKNVDISLNSVIIYKCQGGPDTKYIIIH